MCTAPETEIDYLSGWTAGHLDPRKHGRIKKHWCQGWHNYTAYLMPNPELATEVREEYRWLNLFDATDNDGINPKLIAEAKKVILESYDLEDNLLDEYFVYDRETREVTKEYHNS